MRAAKVAVFALALVPLALLIWRAAQGELGANPIEFVTHLTGDWTIRFLIITLTITPARKLLGWPELIRFRRMLGLFAFFYGCLHFLTYLVADKFFDFAEITRDIAKRPFITVGFAGFLLLVPLAVTSTSGWIRRLGGKNWRALHRLVYVSAVAGVVHYWWLVKSDVRLPLLYGTLVAVLLAFRGASAWLRRTRPAERRLGVTAP
ncbi:MAG TPA: protein-methionine-sulfoxide reductase heme-binding subunit MsrQ [Bryobacteraceae bacterium]|nr:protein-methionine-sulfoxide reductase heme-binding subunit MsrQ [Bryobacteraceae bacterium]